MTEHRLRFILFGTPVLQHSPQAAIKLSEKGIALLAYLCLEKRPVARTTLTALLWPEHPTQRANANLRTLLSRLRKALPEGVLQADRQRVMLGGERPVWCDAVIFETQCQTLEQLSNIQIEAVIDLYTAEFMAGFSLADAPDFNNWLFATREHLQHIYLSVLEQLSQQALAAGQPEHVVRYAQVWQTHDPLAEAPARYLMQAYAQQGALNSVREVYKQLQQVLHVELGVEPTEATTNLYYTLTTSDGVPNNLPSDMTSFIGREHELDEIYERLRDPDCALLTLVGLGGSGKTRAAIAAGRRLALTSKLFPHGIYFVPLETTHTAEELLSAIAHALNLEIPQDKNLTKEIQRFLSRKQLLVILDNFEQLIQEDILEILKSMVQVKTASKWLLTSRQPTKLSMEWLVEIKGLQYQQKNFRDLTVSKITKSEAGMLLLTRCKQHQVQISQTRAAALALARMIKFVDGSPLGLEIAASSLRYVTPEQLVQRIGDSIVSFPSQNPDIPARHRSLNIIFKDTLNVLLPVEKTVVLTLAYTDGYFTFDAAISITQTNRATIFSLIDASLIKRFNNGVLGFHPALKQFLKTQYVDPQDLHNSRIQQVSYYAHISTSLLNLFYAGGEVQALDTIGLEIENFFQAVKLAVSHKMWTEAEAILLAIELHGKIRARFRKTLRLLDSLDLPTHHKHAQRFNNICSLIYGTIYSTIALYDKAEKHIDSCLPFFFLKDDMLHYMRCCNYKGIMSAEKGYHHESEVWFIKARNISQLIELDYFFIVTSNNLGILFTRQGQYSVASDFFMAAFTVNQNYGSKILEADTLNGLGRIAEEQEDWEMAREYLFRSMAINRQYGFLEAMTTNLYAIISVEIKSGNLNSADKFYQELLDILAVYYHPRQEANAYQLKGKIELERNNVAKALEYFSIAEKIYAENQLPLSQYELNTTIGLWMAQNGHCARAWTSLQNAFNLFKEFDSWPHKASLLEAIIEICEHCSPEFAGLFKLYLASMHTNPDRLSAMQRLADHIALYAAWDTASFEGIPEETKAA